MLRVVLDPNVLVSALISPADVPAQPTSGDYWVNEAYAEMTRPDAAVRATVRNRSGSTSDSRATPSRALTCAWPPRPPS